MGKHVIAGINFTQIKLDNSEFEDYLFKNCQFSGQNLSKFQFVNCEFEGCEMSNVQVRNTALVDVMFKNSKLLGVRFDECSTRLLSIAFESCILDLSSFYTLKLKGIVFKHCSLKEVDFVESDLSNASFPHCNLLDAKFDATNLEGVDFRTAEHIQLDPERNKIRKAKFDLNSLPGLLGKYQIKVG
jgi:fluoroquinolone resistance protein